MANRSPSYLERIPDELKIIIFSYLSTYDVLNLFKIPTFAHLSFEKNLVSKISVYKEYRLGIKNNIILKEVRIRGEVITSLNINCVYWIPARELRKCFYKLPKLESLYAVDTQLNRYDYIVYESLPHLKTLALTVSDYELEDGDIPCTIVNLYLHLEFYLQESVTKLSTILNKLTFLKELWVIDFSAPYSEITCMNILPLLPSSVEKLTLMTDKTEDLDLINAYQFNGTISFKNSYKVADLEMFDILRFQLYPREVVQVCFDRFDGSVNNIYNYWNFKDTPWTALVDQLQCLPFSKRDAKRLILGQSTLDDLHCEELNIAHKTPCNNHFRSIIGSLLTSANMKWLKKLSINFCVCEKHGDNEAANEGEPTVKRARFNLRSSFCNKSVLERIIENSPLIEELELWSCTTSHRSKMLNTALSSIQKLKNLKKLTLIGFPVYTDGKFLVLICKNCKHLTSLRIKPSWLGTRKGKDNFYTYLCSALAYATALKDFRYENCHVDVDKILNSLNNIVNLKLERIVLKCMSVETFTAVPLKLFLSDNPQLRFVCMIVVGVPNYIIKYLSTVTKKYKTREKIFLVSNDDDAVSNGIVPIPYIHRREMLHLHSCVSALDLFNGFAK